MNQEAATAGSYLESTWAKVTVWVKSLDLSTMKVAELFAYAGVGFFLGFLLKKHFRILVIFLVSVTVLLWVLAQFDVVIFNWNQVQQLANVRPTDTLNTILTNYVNLAKAHWMPLLGGVLGLLFGYRVG
jgi:uncharacterized membrane protein (Fun14 family)